GRAWLAQAGMSLEAACFDAASDLDAFLSANALPGHAVYTVVLRRKDVTLPLTARSWRPGDRIRRGGGRGTRKLQDLFVDARIPAAQRSRVPVVTDASGIVLAVIGVAVSELALPHGAWQEREESGESGGWLTLAYLSTEL